MSVNAHGRGVVRGLVSVIMPVYNSVTRVDKTIRSVLSQDYGNLELLLIDDGSTDGSNDICRRWTAADRRVRYLPQENHGVSAARNLGMDEARGEFIAFCDHDDEYAEGLISENVVLLTKSNAQFIKFGRVYYQGNAEIKRTEFPGAGCASISSETLPQHYKWMGEQQLLVYVWDAIWRTSFLMDSGARFDETLRGGEEDVRFNCDCVGAFDEMLINACCYYRHHTWETSASRGSSVDKALEVMRTAQYEHDTLLKRYGKDVTPELWSTKSLQYVKVLCNALTCIPRRTMKIDSKVGMLDDLVRLDGGEAHLRLGVAPVRDVVTASMSSHRCYKGLLLMARANRLWNSLKAGALSLHPRG